MKFPRFYPILDSGLLDQRGLPIIDAAGALLNAGVAIIQFRHKGQYTRTAFEAAETVRAMCREAGALFVVNDRADIARLLDADLHLGQDDLRPADARLVIGASRLLGLSTHNEEQARAALAEPVDYLAFGPIFSTSSKVNPDPVAGLAMLRRVRELIDRPLIAIGGITQNTARRVLNQGADSIAVIADLYPEPLTAAALKARASEWLAATGPP